MLTAGKIENFTPSDQCWCWLVQNCSSWEVNPILFIIPLHFPCLLRASLLHTSTTFFSSLQFKVQLRGCHTSSRQPHHCHNHLLISDKATMSGMRCAKYNSGDCTGTGLQWRLLAIVAAEDPDGAGAVSHHRLPPIVSCIGRGRTQPPPPPPATTTKLHRAAQDEGGFPWRLLSPPWQHHYATTAGCTHTNHPYTLAITALTGDSARTSDTLFSHWPEESSNWSFVV